MPSLDPKLLLLIVLAAGLFGAVFTSLFGRPQDDRPNPAPYVGFLFGALLGGMGAFAWRHFL